MNSKEEAMPFYWHLIEALIQNEVEAMLNATHIESIAEAKIVDGSIVIASKALAKRCESFDSCDEKDNDEETS